MNSIDDQALEDLIRFLKPHEKAELPIEMMNSSELRTELRHTLELAAWLYQRTLNRVAGVGRVRGMIQQARDLRDSLMNREIRSRIYKTQSDVAVVDNVYDSIEKLNDILELLAKSYSAGRIMPEKENAKRHAVAVLLSFWRRHVPGQMEIKLNKDTRNTRFIAHALQVVGIELDENTIGNIDVSKLPPHLLSTE